MSRRFFTVGHSNHTSAGFTELLHAYGIELVVDVRRLPGSNRYPQFNEDTLSSSLAEAGIGFRRAQGLTGRRPASEEVPPDVNGWWRNRSFHNYADHALSEDFRSALDQVRDRGREYCTTVMCSEAVWWKCHRRIIADHLLGRGEEVVHILGLRRSETAGLTAGAMVGEAGDVTYPAAQKACGTDSG
ncbi:hypothetical protein GCM10007147_24810 [Nocardiopsis kunsanensis]|uniref:DUF488 domain-containing protein n=1 Tax=Nocardiopsis kunsanensis TaxID=141693 RepID=A0A919CHQ0_9ACTN|nr:DUF488 domain-containing protein [Nocardiopsis kunsanensis]GHD26637.1 hypothetical protein GCM10007147_24810 [Nocardiopsis kunsanensis]